jgi:hypothetical protein
MRDAGSTLAWEEQGDTHKTAKSPQALLRPPGIRTLVAPWAGTALLARVLLVVAWFVAEYQLSVVGRTG